MQCQICMKPGHTAVRCFQRFTQPSNNESSPKNALIATPSTIQDSSWYVDSGATNHITADLQNMSLYNDYSGSDKITVGNGESILIHHTGSLDQGLYRLDPNTSFPLLTSATPSPSQFALVGELTTFNKWHERLGHPASSIVQKVMSSSNIPVKGSSSQSVCSSCQLGKSYRLPFEESSFVSTAPLEFVFSDVWGKSPIQSNKVSQLSSPIVSPIVPIPLTSPQNSYPPTSVNLPSSECTELVDIPIHCADSSPSSTQLTIPVTPLAPSHHMLTRSKTNSLKPKVFNVTKYALSSELVEPTYYSQAKGNPLWEQAMQEEYNALLNNKTWSLVSAPSTYRKY
ncbi:hypothetical protein LIER_09890 [Lithospermum erythrorhizon]|uniref:GAG-pre-integrase domain-containing protein n=1 Tax=Lithospermum erythrorhizon TaxID=34254 RepID=A0AAV3PLM0_LITER